MKNLRGSEQNPISLIPEDFEEAVVVPSYKVQIYKNGWKNVDGAINATVDFQGSITDGVVSSSLTLTINDETAKYHPLSGTQYSDYFTFRRKIRVFIGIKKDENPYTWSYFTGNVNTMQHKKIATSKGLQRTVTIRALDYCDILNTFKFDKNVYWGSTTNITLQENIYEYAMPLECKGIHHVTKDGVEFLDWTYNWETNKIAITKDETGTLKVYYFTSQNVITVLQDILLATGVISSSEDLIYEPTDKTINRAYFDEGTTALEAVKNLSQLINYRFWFDGDGIPHFEPVTDVGETADFTFKDYKNLQVETVNIEDREFYNAVEVFGEERIRRQYYKAEIQLGSTIESYLDATTESRTHNFSFTNYGRLRYELDCTNKNGLTAELNEKPSGAEITITHNPERSRAEEETSLGYITGSLFYALDGQNIINTSDIKFLDHVAATRIRAIISDSYNKYGMQVSLTPESYWKTRIYLSHDPLRNLSSTVQNIGTVNSNALPSGKLITVPFTSGKIWGRVKWETNYEDGWGAEQQTGSGSWVLNVGEYDRIVTINLSQNYQGQMRWTGTAPSNIPISALQLIAQNANYIPGHTTAFLSASAGTANIDLIGTHEVGSINLQVLRTFWSGVTYYVVFQNTQSSPIIAYVRIYGRIPGNNFSINYVDSGENWARFKLSQSLGKSNPNFSIKVYSKRKPYNIKVTNTKQTEFNAEFLATCEFGSPAVSITCKGQEPVARQYRVDLYGYKLIPRYYFLKLFGREIVSELTSSIYSQKTLTPEEIQETGGKKTLTIRNHLVQSQSEAETIAQNLLNHYRQIINSFVIEVSCPPPLEVGDTVSIVSQY